MSRRALLVALLACGVAGLSGYLAGRLAQPAAADGAVSAPLAEAAAPAPSARRGRPVVAARYLRPAEAPATELPPAASPAPDGTPAADPQVVADARSLIDGAIARGDWTDREVEALRPIMGRLPDAEIDALLATLLPAINEGRVRLDVSGPPL